MNADVIVAGGSIAGAAVTAALSEFGYSVLVVEPGLDHTRRLAGELIHSPGVANLNDLGLLACLEKAGAMPVHGFAIMTGAGTQLLPYSDVPELKNHGIALEHRAMATALLDAIAQFPNVTVWKGARVTGVDLTSSNHAVVTVTHDGQESRCTPRLLVAADGRNSHLRGMAGIGHKQVHLSNMMGYVVKSHRLPHSGFGHVFVGAASPVLAYDIGCDETRIMFDVSLQTTSVPPRVLESLPSALRDEVNDAAKAQSPLRAANYSVVPDAIFKGRMVCVGDAGGCCHPLTATGLSACARDAILLRRALRETSADIPAAFRRYASLREGPQRTRLAGAELLYRVFSAETPDMRLMRNGLFRYWQSSERGRAATMALLSTHEDRFPVMLREYINVCRSALPDLVRWRGINSANPSYTRSHAVVGLSRELIKLVGNR